MSLLTEFWNAGGFKKARNLGMFLELVREIQPSVRVNSRGETEYSSGNAGAMLVALIFFLLLYAIYRYALQHGAPNGTPPMAIWMWDDVIKPPTSGTYSFESSKVIASPKQFLTWAKKKGVNQLWLDISAYSGTAPQLVPLLSGAKKQGMAVQFMCFAASPIPATNVATLPKLFSTIAGIGDKALWPVAIQSNLEAGLGSKANATQHYKAHQSLKQQLAAFNAKHGTNIRAVASVFFWWINYEGGNAPTVNGMAYGEALLKLGFDVTVQDYRKPVPSYSHKPAIAWSKMADSYGQSAYIGMLVGPPGTGTYFYWDKIGSLDQDMQALAASCNDLDGFAGMAVHDALWYGRYSP